MSMHFECCWQKKNIKKSFSFDSRILEFYIVQLLFKSRGQIEFAVWSIFKRWCWNFFRQQLWSTSIHHFCFDQVQMRTLEGGESSVWEWDLWSKYWCWCLWAGANFGMCRPLSLLNLLYCVSIFLASKNFWYFSTTSTANGGPLYKLEKKAL